MNKYMDIIPTPKKCTYTLGDKICVSTFCVVGDMNAIVQSGIKMLEEENIRLIDSADTADFVVYSDLSDAAGNYFSEDELSVFAQKYGKEQGYVLKRIANGKIIAVAQSPQGCVYAMTTLLQIIDKEAGTFAICDAPDFKCRGIKWTLWAEVGCWGYDFGDGTENLKKRLERKLRTAAKYKINLIYADGYGFDTERFPGYTEIMRYLCDTARGMGIKIVAGGYTMSYALADHKDAYQGKVFLNRKHYPDGGVYECLGRHMAHAPEITGRTRGTCLSNDALFEQKIEEIVSFVAKTHIGALTLHNMDSHEIHPEYWMARCDMCRKKWPNDSLFAKDGAAGAFAEFIDKLMDRIRTVKDGDYDASEDFMLRFVSPGYLYANWTPDDAFDMGVEFWKSVSEYIKNPDNLAIGFREEFFYHDKNEKRMPHITDNIEKVMTYIANFNGCDGAYSDKLFAPTSALNYMQKGADTITCYSGTAFCEPLVPFNAEYMWNSENSGFYNVEPKPDNYNDFYKLYSSMLECQFRPDEVYKDGGFLDIICQKLYGNKTGLKMTKLYKLCGENGESPVPCAAWKDICTNYGSTAYPMAWNNHLSKEEIHSFVLRFYQNNKVTGEAYEIIKDVIFDMDANSDTKADLETLCECFYMGKMLTELLYEYMLIFENADSVPRVENPEELCNRISSFKNRIGEFDEYVKTNTPKTVDKFGGIFINRKEMVSFFKQNTDAMELSVRTGNRFADEVTVKEWDE